VGLELFDEALRAVETIQAEAIPRPPDDPVRAAEHGTSDADTLDAEIALGPAHLKDFLCGLDYDLANGLKLFFIHR
jgi:hypothetical protein